MWYFKYIWNLFALTNFKLDLMELYFNAQNPKNGDCTMTDKYVNDIIK